MNLLPTTVATALPIVAKVLGIDLKTNRTEAIEYLNRIRSLQYHNFHRIKLFDDLIECVGIQTFNHDCFSGECGCYEGISLPLSMAGPVSAWVDNYPATLRSRWMEKDVGRSTWGPGLSLIERPGVFPTSSDPNGCQHIKLTSLSRKDEGKHVQLVATDCNGEKIEFCMTLIGNGVCESDVCVSQISSVVLPVLCDGVTMSEVGSGRILAEYSPLDPSVPSFRRFKLQKTCSGCSVLVQASRAYSDVYFDTDIVEIGDRLVLEHGSRYFLYGEAGTDKKEINRAELDLAKMYDLIRGMLARHQGGHNQDGNPLHKQKRSYGQRMPGYSGRARTPYR